jgi:hypothetical protein
METKLSPNKKCIKKAKELVRIENLIKLARTENNEIKLDKLTKKWNSLLGSLYPTYNLREIKSMAAQ